MDWQEPGRVCEFLMQSFKSGTFTWNLESFKNIDFPNGHMVPYAEGGRHGLAKERAGDAHHMEDAT